MKIFIADTTGKNVVSINSNKGVIERSGDGVLEKSMGLVLSPEEFSLLVDLFYDFKLHADDKPIPLKFSIVEEKLKGWYQDLMKLAYPEVVYDENVEQMKNVVIHNSKNVAGRIATDIQDALSLPRKIID